MQETSSTAELEAPLRGRVGAAYGQIIRQTESPRDIEHRVFAQITAEMESVTPQMMPGERARILGRNRELWNILTFCAIDDNNQLPVELRAKIVSLGRWADGECSRVLQDNASLSGLIELNKTIMRGLASAPAGGS